MNSLTGQFNMPRTNANKLSSLRKWIKYMQKMENLSPCIQDGRTLHRCEWLCQIFTTRWRVNSSQLS